MPTQSQLDLIADAKAEIATWSKEKQEAAANHPSVRRDGAKDVGVQLRLPI